MRTFDGIARRLVENAKVRMFSFLVSFASLIAKKKLLRLLDKYFQNGGNWTFITVPENTYMKRFTGLQYDLQYILVMQRFRVDRYIYTCIHRG